MLATYAGIGLAYANLSRSPGTGEPSRQAPDGAAGQVAHEPRAAPQVFRARRSELLESPAVGETRPTLALDPRARQAESAATQGADRLARRDGRLQVRRRARAHGLPHQPR